MCTAAGGSAIPGVARVTKRRPTRCWNRVYDWLRKHGLPCAWTAFRAEWGPFSDFFQAHGFRPVREIINYVMDLVAMPTPAAKVGIGFTPLTAEDLPAMLSLTPNVLRARTPEELGQHLLHNPLFPADSVFVLRNRNDDLPRAVGDTHQQLHLCSSEAG